MAEVLVKKIKFKNDTLEKMVAVRFSKNHYAQLKKNAETNETTTSNFVRVIVLNYLNQKRKV